MEFNRRNYIVNKNVSLNFVSNIYIYLIILMKLMTILMFLKLKLVFNIFQIFSENGISR